MGTAKALVEVGGVAMASRVAAALRAAGADPVVLVGGDPSWSARLGLPQVPDRWPGEGPLGGIATALLDAGGPGPAASGTTRHDPSEQDIVVVAACDQPHLDGLSLRRLVDALVSAQGAEVAAAVDEIGRRTPFPAAWRALAGPLVARAVDGGERRADAAFSLVRALDVPLAAAVLADVDRPSDLDP